MLIELLPKLEFRGLSDEEEEEITVDAPADLEDDEDDEEDGDDMSDDADDDVAPEEQ